MTLVEERPTTEPASAVEPPAAWSPTASWRLAARLARREVRRRPGRTALVMLLVAVPILAMTIGAILVRSDTDEATFTRAYGTADLVLTDHGGYLENGRRAEPVDLTKFVGDVAPNGTTSTEILMLYTFVTTVDGRQVTTQAIRFDPTSPITDGIIDVTAGRLPAARNEVLLQAGLAEELGIDVGDELTLARPDRTLDVVGLGRPTADHDTPLMLFGQLDRSEVRSAAISTLVDLPAGFDTARFLASAQQSDGLPPEQLSQLSVQTRDDGWFNYGTGGRPDFTTEQLAWGWVIGVLALMATGIIIAAAFATSARRQLATVGQLAANGASPRLVRRTLSLQGTWSGAVGATLGVALGVGVFLLGRPVVERFVGWSWTHTVIRPTDLLVLLVTGTVAGTIAALLPARSLATTSVLSALAGRRPIRPVNPRSVAIGAVSFVSGLLLLAVATAGGNNNNDGGGSDNLFAAVAVIGGLAILAGMCLAAPLAVSAATAIAARLGPSWRMSARSLHRTRWRSAAVVTAIAVTGAFAVAAATVATGLDDDYLGETTDLPRNEALLRTSNGGGVDAIGSGMLADVRAVMDPSAETIDEGIDLPVPSDDQLAAAWQASEDAAPSDPVTTPAIFTASDVTVVDDEYLDAMGMSGTDRTNLNRTGAMTLYSYGDVADGRTLAETRSSPIRLLGADREVIVDAAPLLDGLRNRNGSTGVLMTRDGAAAAGLDVIPVGIRFTSDDDLTEGQRRGLDKIQFSGSGYEDLWIVGDESADIPTNLAGRTPYWVSYQWVDSQPSSTLVQTGIVAATLMLVLIVVGIGLSLAAVESRDERNTLIAVGASPSRLRRRSATTAILLAVTGGVLAIPAGLLPVVVVNQAQTYPTGLSIPWLSIVSIVVFVPVAVGAIALVGSSILQRLHPPKVMQAFTE